MATIIQEISKKFTVELSDSFTFTAHKGRIINDGTSEHPRYVMQIFTKGKQADVLALIDSRLDFRYTAEGYTCCFDITDITRMTYHNVND